MGRITRRGSLALAAAVAATLAVAPSASADWTDGTDVPGEFNTTARLAGEDRYETAVAASADLRAASKVGDYVIVGNAFNYSDVLAAAPLADLVDAPVLITAADSLNDSVAAELAALKEYGVSNVIILGGESAVSAGVQSAIEGIFKDDTDSIERIGGVDRYETAVLIAEKIDYLDLPETDALRVALDDARKNLADYVAAQEALDAAIADLQEAAAALAPALADQAAAVEQQQAAVAAAVEIASRLATDTDPADYGYVGYTSWADLIEDLLADYEAAADAIAPYQDALATLIELETADADATVGAHRAAAVEAGDTELVADIDAAIALGVVAEADLPEDGINAAQAEIDVLQPAVDAAVEELSNALADQAEAAAAQEGNEEVLAELAEANAAIEAANQAVIDADAAYTAAVDAYNAAERALDTAVANLTAFGPTSVELLEQDVLEARQAIIAASDNEVFLTTGVIFPDALSAGAAAGEEQGVVLLTRGTEFDSRGFTEAFLEQNQADVYAIGGPSAAAVEADAEYVGTDRFETAKLVAEEFYTDASVVGVAAGYHERFPDDSQAPDAVVASAYMANNDGPLVLTKNDELPGYTEDYLRFSSPSNVVIFGGPTAISPAVGAAIDAALDY